MQTTLEIKPFWTSKTFWFNTLSFVAAALMLLAGSPLLSAYAGWLLLGSSLVNLGLRFLTDTAISLSKNPDSNLHDL